MSNQKRAIFFLTALCLVTNFSLAQTHKDTLKLNRPVPKVYKFNDNLFWGISGGVGYSMSEFVRKEPFFTMISPHADLEFGKHLNKWFAARVMLGYHSQRASCDSVMTRYFPEAKSYTFSMISGYADAMFNIDRLFSRYNPEEKHQFWAFGGIGGMLCFGYSKKLEEWQEIYPINTSTKIHPAWRVGLEWHYKVSRSTSFVVRGLYATSSSPYDGKELDSGSSRHFAELSFGVNVHLGNRYGQRHFEDCSHNANRYFEVMNGRLQTMHEKANKQKAKEIRKKTGQKVAPETNITEADSILLFPVDYYYLTYLQKAKLKKMAAYLEAHPDEIAHIHIYPDAKNTGSMDMEFRVKNRAERVAQILTEEIKLQKERYIITTHPDKRPPYPRQHIFCLGGLIKYEKQ